MSIGDPPDFTGANSNRTFNPSSSPTPHAVGNPLVLRLLKKKLEIPVDESMAAVLVEPDQFALLADSPLRKEHEQLTKLLIETASRQDRREIQDYLAKNFPKPSDPIERGRLALAAIERRSHYLLQHPDLSNEQFTPIKHALAWTATLSQLREFELDREGLFDFLLYVSSFYKSQNLGGKFYENNMAKVAAFEMQTPLTEGERYVLSLYRSAMTNGDD